MFWDKEYENSTRIWGDGPSELAIITVKYLQNHRLNKKFLSIADIGCGYGRDCLYLAKHLNCRVFGIDTSQKAIEILKNSIAGPYTKAIEYKCCNFTLNELLELAKSENQIYTNISIVFDFLFDIQELPTETIIKKLIEVSNT